MTEPPDLPGNVRLVLPMRQHDVDAVVRDLRYLVDLPGRTEMLTPKHAAARLTGRWLAEQVENAADVAEAEPADEAGRDTDRDRNQDGAPMTARVQVEATTTITLTVTPADAERIIADFDQRREPSLPGKALYTALVTAARRGEGADRGER